MMSKRLMMAVAVLALACAGETLAQAPQALGTVESLSGGVIVVRGGQTYTLSAGDQIFPGDRVVTRTGANVVLRSLQTPPCDKVLTGAQAIIVDAAVCTKAAIALGGTELNELAGVGTGGGLSIGATPALFALLALGGTGAALSNSSSSASP